VTGRTFLKWARLLGGSVLVLFGVVGLSAVLGWLDYVLLPALAVFIGITLYALWRRGRS